MNLPPFPDDYIPTSPEARRRLIAWGMDCARMGAEAERLSFYPAQVSGEPATVRCWCETCRPNTMNDMRMIVCPDCGNKRCPKANDHRNACTNSNAVGQKGSSWEHVKPLDAASVDEGRE